MVDGKMVAEPSYDEEREAEFTIVVTGTEHGIVMVEAGGTGVSEDKVVDAIEFGHECCRKIIAGIRELMAKAGKQKRVYTPAEIDQEMYDKIATKVRADLTDAMNTEKYKKIDSYHTHRELKKSVADGVDEAKRSQATATSTRLKEASSATKC